MKNYIKTLAMLLMVSLGVVSCNDTEEFDDYKVIYPTSVPLGYYHSVYTIDSNYEYGVLLTKNDKDSIVFQLIMEGKPTAGKDSATVRTLLTTTEVSYNDTIGTLTAVDASGQNFYETNMTACMAYQKNKHQMTLSVEYGKKKFISVLVPTTDEPSVASRWIANGLVLDLKNVGETPETLPGLIYTDPTNEEAKPEKLVYSYAAKSGEFTTESGKKGTFSYNENYQLVVTYNNTTYTCNRTFSVSEPEKFVQVANGVYSHSVGVIEGGQVFTDVYESSLYQSDKNPNSYIIAPWANSESGLNVLVNPTNGSIVVPRQYTGIDDKQHGQISAVDVASYTGGQVQSNSHFDGKVFHLDLAYVVSQGFFGMVNETFEITETAATNDKAKAVKRNNLTYALSGQKLYKKNF